MPAIPVLLVIPNLEYGGGQRTFQLIAGHVRDGIVFHVACDPVEPFWGRMGAMGVCRHPVQFGRIRLLATVMELMRIIRQEQIQVVHSQGRRADAAALVAARLCRVPAMTTVAVRVEAFDVGPLRKRAYQWVEAWMDRRFILQIAVSKTGEQALLASGVPADRIFQLSDALDVNSLLAARLPKREACLRLGLDPTKQWVGSLGRLVNMKGHAVLVQAAARLRHLPSLRCVIAGAGPLAQDLQRLAQRLELGDRLQWLPFQEDPAALYSALDCLVFPSLYSEGFPGVLLEAMVFGLPIVASDLAASHEVLGDNAFAQFVPPGDAPLLAAAIQQLCADPAQLARLGQQACQYAVERYDVAAFAPRVRQAYQQALTMGQPGRAVMAHRR